MNPKEQILKAIDCEDNKRFFEAEYHYMRAIENLFKLVNGMDGEQKKNYRERIETYIRRVEEIKIKLKNFRTNVDFLQNIPIGEDATACTFDSLFGSHFDESVKEMIIEETYLNNWHKISNLLSFLEFALKKCPHVSFISVITKKNTNGEQSNQTALFSDITRDLNARNILIEFNFDDAFHDRKIILNNGIIIKIGRGLDFYKPLDFSIGLGLHDFYWRKCKKTEVDIMRSKETL